MVLKLYCLSISYFCNIKQECAIDETILVQFKIQYNIVNHIYKNRLIISKNVPHEEKVKFGFILLTNNYFLIIWLVEFNHLPIKFGTWFEFGNHSAFMDG